MITRPTRYSVNRTATLIDYIITNDVFTDKLSGVVLEDFLDHLPISLVTGQTSVASKTSYLIKQVIEINDDNIAKLVNRLEGAKWPIVEDGNIDLVYTIFHIIFSDVYNETFPTQTEKKSNCTTINIRRRLPMVYWFPLNKKINCITLISDIETLKANKNI